MKVFLSATDAGESACLKSFAEALANRKHIPLQWLGEGKHLAVSENIVMDMCATDLLIIGISNENGPQIALTKVAREENIPVVAYAPGGHAFRITPELGHLVDVLFLGNEDEIEEAREAFPGSRVFAIGNIMTESNPPIPVEEARQIVGFAEDKKIIFVPGDKGDWVNWFLCQSVIQATNRITELSPMVAIGLHPGITPSEEDADRETKRFSSLNNFSRTVPVRIFTKFTVPSSVLVTACDIMVTAVSTLAEAAAYQRKPVIGFWFEAMLAEIAINQNGRKFEWEHEQNKTAAVIHNGSNDDLSKVMYRLLQSDNLSINEMRQRQELHYPSPPAPGSIAKKAVDLIEELVESRKAGVGDFAS